MSQEVVQNELKAKTQQLMDGPLKHIRAAAIAAALLPLASVAATPASAQTQCASGGVCGTVFNDVNNNGIQDAGETGIEGVKVFVCQLCNGTDTIQTETDQYGQYLFTSGVGGQVVDGQKYTVSAQIPTGTQASPPNVCCDESLDSDGTPNGAGSSVASGVVSNGKATDFGFAPSGFTNPGTGTPGYWKSHSEAWPVAGITIGTNTYTKDQAIDWLKRVSKDKTTTIFASYVSAYLNGLMNNDTSCVTAAMSAAYAWLSAHPVGSNIAASSVEWQQIEWAHQTLDSYNNGLLCAPHRQ